MIGRVLTAMDEEGKNLDVRVWAATSISRALPPLVGNRLRTRALRLAGVTIGHGTTFGGGVHLSGVKGKRAPSKRLVIGQRCWINVDCMFDASADITIADDVAIGHGVSFITNTHEVGPSQSRAGQNISQPISVGAGSWIGARSTILPGVDIGAGCIVAAGSVVNRNVPPNTLVAGVPARTIRTLPS